MLKFSEYNEMSDIFEEQIKVLNRKIEYRKLELKKNGFMSCEGEVTYDPSSTTRPSTVSATTISVVSNVASSSIYKVSPCEVDEELAKLKYELEIVEKRYSFMRKNGVLPD